MSCSSDDEGEGGPSIAWSIDCAPSIESKLAAAAAEGKDDAGEQSAAEKEPEKSEEDPKKASF
jgi:hypothetical protein